MADSSLHILPDGLLRFGVQSKDGTVREHAIDVLILRMACDECVLKHNLQTERQPDGSEAYKMTAAFLSDLAATLAGLGVEGCTPSVARQLWFTSIVGIDELQKKTNETPSSPTGSTSTPEE